jgi:hypothetical protein
MTTFRIQELEILGFEWDSHGAAWDERLKELADYRKIHGHCNVPRKYSKATPIWEVGSNPKGNTSCTEKERRRRI